MNKPFKVSANKFLKHSPKNPSNLPKLKNPVK
jgi:hypothetical protein